MAERGWRKMNLRRIAVLLLGASLLLGLSALGSRASAAAGQERVITIYASSYSYAPSVIRVNPGDVVTLRLVSEDVVHGIYIDGYDLNLVADPGRTESLTFTADRAGTFRLRCSVTCGALHPFMIGKLQVGGGSLALPAGLLAGLAAAAALLWKEQR
jgi:plastocyanin